MRILANENIPEEAVTALREKGHDVVWIRTDYPGDSDEQVLDRAVRETRVVVTFDKDFGELAFRRKQSAVEGIILFRVPTTSSAQVARVIVAAIETRTDWRGHFSVVEENRIRSTPLPQRKGES